MRRALSFVSFWFVLAAVTAFAFIPDTDYLRDRKALDTLQQDTFRYMWEGADPDSGMAYEGTYFDWDVRPVTTGGTGFGIAAIVVASDRGWITREQAVERLLKITRFLRDKTPRHELHGAFPHWLNGSTGAIIPFGKNDDGADIVETSLLMQGLLIARAYFNGPGVEETLRGIITGLWEDVDWNFFTNGERGIYWHWSPSRGFRMGLKILGNNECLITYVLAMSSPTHPISRKAYDYWTSGKGYQPKNLFGYRVEASLPGGGPLFLSQYSFIGLDPRRLSDAFVPGGYFARNTRHVLSNRSYSLYEAPAAHLYSEKFWGLTAGHTPKGYAAAEPSHDPGSVAPTGALASMPYTPHYAMEFLQALQEKYGDTAWGPYGPYDGVSLKDDWVSDVYLAIDQLPIVSMVENYRTGLLWKLLMADPDIRAGLEAAGLVEPEFASGFPEAVVTVRKTVKGYVPDAYDIRRHPDSGMFMVPYWSEEPGPIRFELADARGKVLLSAEVSAVKGRNTLAFPQFMRPDGDVLTLTMFRDDDAVASLPVRLF